jgi:hypothetical protein
MTAIKKIFFILVHKKIGTGKISPILRLTGLDRV